MSIEEINAKPSLKEEIIINDIDMPEINYIPISDKEKILLNSSYYLDDDADTSNTSYTYESEVPLIEDKINEKIIDNAIKTEKTMRKYFKGNFNPNLQPSDK